MHIVSDFIALKKALDAFKSQHQSIAFVPTMGNLHEGHMALIREAHQHADIVVCSIFVNPTQFGENEDLNAYPRSLEEDKKKLMAHNCQLLYLPDRQTMYPSPNYTSVHIDHITQLHCGTSRPHHFVGVASIVLKFFNQIQPNYAIFGLKDYQQFTVIKTMIEDLFLPITLIGVDTGRAQDGLAHSSRNTYLTSDERAQAPILYQVLKQTAQHIIHQGTHDFAELTRTAKQQLHQAGFVTDYFNISRQQDLSPAQEGDTQLVILAAAFLGKARLIDNITLNLDSVVGSAAECVAGAD